MKYLLMFALVLLGIDAAYALRCGNRLISEGDSTAKVLAECGQPTLVEQREELVPIINRHPHLRRGYNYDYIVVPYEAWTYNFGPQRFMQRLRIRNGRVTRIESLGYGY